ncbi:MAG: hypothetical protein AAF197_10300, partial [Pseudomonadota bacterium]
LDDLQLDEGEIRERLSVDFSRSGLKTPPRFLNNALKTHSAPGRVSTLAASQPSRQRRHAS